MVFALAGCFFWANWVVSYFHGQNKYKITELINVKLKKNQNTVQSRALTRVTIQKIKYLGVLQFEFYVVKGGATNRDMSLTETC